MLRILGEISVYGSAASLERLVSTASIQNGVLKQIGTLRKVPDKDFWCYASPRYRFHADTLDEEVRGFLTAHKRLGEALAINDAGIRYALFTLCPVDQSYEEAFACLLGKDTLRVLSDLGLALEIAPESVMPEAEYWVKREAS